jgi:hypothetical protein
LAEKVAGKVIACGRVRPAELEVASIQERKLGAGVESRRDTDPVRWDGERLEQGIDRIPCDSDGRWMGGGEASSNLLIARGREG